MLFERYIYQEVYNYQKRYHNTKQIDCNENDEPQCAKSFNKNKYDHTVTIVVRYFATLVK